MIKCRPFDASEFLDNEETITAYMHGAWTSEAPALFPIALGEVARARGMTWLANETGLSREALYRALSKGGNPTWDTLRKVMRALNVNLAAKFPDAPAPRRAPKKPKALRRPGKTPAGRAHGRMPQRNGHRSTLVA